MDPPTHTLNHSPSYNTPWTLVLFVTASHQTGLDTRSMTWRSVYSGALWEVGLELRLKPFWSMLVIGSLSAMWAWWALLDMDSNMGPGTDAWLLFKLDQEVQCYTMLSMTLSPYQTWEPFSLESVLDLGWWCRAKAWLPSTPWTLVVSDSLISNSVGYIVHFS